MTPLLDADARDRPPSRSHERPRRARGLTLLFVAASVLLVVAGVAAVVGMTADDARDPKTIEIVVPAGTQGRIEAGEKVVIMPTRLEFAVGDSILIRNEDDVVQSVGPYVVDAGQELLLQYGAPGVYEGYCPLSEGDRYEIVVEG